MPAQSKSSRLGRRGPAALPGAVAEVPAQSGPSRLGHRGLATLPGDSSSLPAEDPITIALALSPSKRYTTPRQTDNCITSKNTCITLLEPKCLRRWPTALWHSQANATGPSYVLQCTHVGGFRWKTLEDPILPPHPARLRFFSLWKALTVIICGHRLSVYYFTLHSERNAKNTVHITTKIYACGRAHS